MSDSDFMEAITDENRDEAMNALVRIADQLTKLGEAIFSNLHGESPNVASAWLVMNDEDVEQLLAMARMVSDAWKDFREIRDPTHNEFYSFMMVNSILQEQAPERMEERGIIPLSRIMEVREELLASGECNDASIRDGINELDVKIATIVMNE